MLYEYNVYGPASLRVSDPRTRPQGETKDAPYLICERCPKPVAITGAQWRVVAALRLNLLPARVSRADLLDLVDVDQVTAVRAHDLARRELLFEFCERVSNEVIAFSR